MSDDGLEAASDDDLDWDGLDDEGDGWVPASYAQKRLWFLQRLDPTSAAYHVPVVLRARGALAPEALRAALLEVMQRHEALRTRLVEQDDELVQVVEADVGDPIASSDLAHLGERDRDATAAALVAEDASRPFDLSVAPLLRARLLRLSDRDWLFVLVMHHVVTDGWSTGVLVRELAELYAARVDGRPARLPTLTVQYSDYALWQRQRLNGPELERQVGYWRERLRGAPPRLELPTDRPRPKVKGERGGAVPVVLGADLQAQVRSLARELGATEFMVLLAAWQLLLGRYARSEDVVVGTPIAGRPDADLEPLIGFFVNTLVLRTDLSGDPSFRELVARVKEGTLDAFGHQDVPFEKLVEALSPPREPNVTPLFQVMFALQNIEASELVLPAVTLRPEPGAEQAEKFDLSLGLGADGAGTLSYDAGLFDRESAERMARRFVVLLQESLRAPGARLSELSELDAEEAAGLRGRSEGLRSARPGWPSAEAAFRAQVARAPEAVALRFGEATWSYGALDARAARWGGGLRALGVGLEDRVALCLSPSADFVTAALAVWKAGGAYVSMDPSLPLDRLRYMVEDSGARVVLVDAARAPELSSLGVPAVATSALEQGGADGARPSPMATNLAYVIYTSGTTGRPKGVGLEHAGLLNLCAAHHQYCPVQPGARTTQVAGLGFDASVMELWPNLLAGAEVCVLDEVTRRDASAVARALRGHAVTHAFLPTPLAVALLRDPEWAPPPSLRTLLVGGDRLPSHDFDALPFEVVNLYGPTEASVVSTGGRARTSEGLPSIGVPLWNTRAWVIGRGGAPVGEGMLGELTVGGANVGRGYLGRPSLTAERFEPDPDSEEPGARRYRTGDLVRWGRSGIEFHGRIDQQVKLRGFRIELGEIESLLGGHPAVADAVVEVRSRAEGAGQLVAYVVWRGAPQVPEVTTHLAAQVPEYMVPSAWVALEALPLTPNGKLDRRALPEPEWEPSGSGYEAPATATEEALSEIWREVLGVERASRRDSFFALGGHSLLATRVVSQVRARLGVELALREVFEHPELRSLASRIEGSGSASRLPALTRVSREGELAPSYAQQRMWTLQRLHAESGAYNMPALVRVEGELDRGALESAYEGLQRRHESLRTRWVESATYGMSQVVLAEPVSRVSWESVSPESVSARAQELASAPMELSSDGPVRLHVLEEGAGSYVVVLVVHHASSDGWSMSLLVQDLLHLYGQARRGEGARPWPTELGYADFAAWQRRLLSGEELSRQQSYWRARLSGLEGLELPRDRARPSVQTLSGGVVSRRLSKGLVSGLSALGARERTTLNVVLLAGFKVLLGRLSGQDDVAVGSPIAGRRLAELEHVVGCFLNTLVLRTRLSGDPSFEEVVRRVRTTLLEAQEHQDIPFEKLLEELSPERDLSRTPWFQVLFNMVNVPEVGEVEVEGARFLPPPSAEETSAKFDLTLYLSPGAEGLSLTYVYNRDLFEASTVEGWASAYESLLERAVEAPGASVRALGRGSVAGGRSAAGPAVEESLVSRWDAWVSRQPTHPAVRWRGEEHSYASLDAASERLAQALSARVSPEGRVGLCFRHGVSMVTGVLGALKSGRAYVALDASYPEGRLSWMVEDAGCEVVVCEASELELASRIGGASRVLRLEELGEVGAVGRGEVRGEALAYLLYTSGSTGRPKGVMQSQRNVLHFAEVFREELGLSPGDRVSCVSAFGFDAAVVDIFGTLMSGATLCPYDLSRDGVEGIGAYVEREGVTILHSTPTVFRAFVRSLPAGGRLRTVRGVVLGGEEALWSDVGLFRGRFGEGSEFVNLMGSSESSITMWESYGEDVLVRSGRLPMGRPVSRTQVLLRDAEGAESYVGEVEVRSPHVALGYWGLPEQSASTFGEVSEGQRWYRAGDWAFEGLDGRLVFLGRRDGQVKVRGYRVDVGEIESVLRETPGVSDAAVVLRGSGESVQLVGYVECADEEALGRAQAQAQGSLPQYMVPTRWQRLERLPRTTSGKVERKALPELAEVRAAYEAPRGALEESLSEIWRELLRVEQVGRGDDFFGLGGHSLLATRLISQVRARLGVELALREVFEHPRLAELARRVEGAERAAALPTIPTLQAVEPMVRVRHPKTGEVRPIPASKLELALARGFAVVDDREDPE